jgi:hypothetical protein
MQRTFLSRCLSSSLSDAAATAAAAAAAAVFCLMQRDDLSAEQRSVLEVMQRTFATYITEKDEAVALKKKLNESEAALAGARNKMKLGYTDPKTGTCDLRGGVGVVAAMGGCARYVSVHVQNSNSNSSSSSGKSC